ncbi:hypothetical protein VCHA37P200_60128 [Vibrio chagasii]|nr:hypothetical protein VCHA53O468_60129 [Vibrio chagasii]CAH7365154.1 hypothetical protein VCHA55O507_60127 [Vibrio chagasii]CAH7452015.1 hypothetical protein VCHA37P200_60128 [Vibrio chagasii]CAH7474255.1 hypothetical protein VCHA43P274_60213 [Vibrio chagasii]
MPSWMNTQASLSITLFMFLDLVIVLLILIKATISHGRHVTYSSQHILLNYIKNGIGSR